MALGVNKPILQVTGYQNSGKTTLMAKLIAEAGRQGWTVASLKHHGHGGTPDRPKDYKDSERHRQAGALAAGVEGGGVLQITAAKTNWRLEEILPLYNSFPVDLLLIEGYKRAGYPKVVLIKEPHELELLEQLVNVQAVISWKPIALQQPTCPVFLLSEEERYINWFVSYMRNSLV
ncbi:molybdopterin-guanine dinucleotide biosynthesis protein B [Bacillus sp. PK3_68]|uniref:molybdopterin-guanine dinucleotide biosynthesis protein B n=1 Tax=Bacillus sp. PK3_68 TaxID=2027408 RepID=UPI000E76FA9F|nr:molybdopterin-guanine dinucleotide biosynthesis protein B [Bacillus sp. PK3_68]RJS59037.1 molybdopterin-guanine dinucleotide biosynthesis protein B [Bacillus sp. PK3_68]